MFPKVLVIVSFICVTVVTMTTLVHHTTMSTFMFYQITFVGEDTITKGFLALKYPVFAVTEHMIVKLTFEWETSFAGFTFILFIIMNVLM